jgi:hypothetical protein
MASENMYKYKGLWAPFIGPLLELAQRADSHDIVVEILGTLANMTVHDLPPKTTWDKLITQSSASSYTVLSFLNKLLVPGFSQVRP